MKRAFAYALAVAVLGAACAYRLVAPGSGLPPEARALSIPVLENESAEPGVEVELTQALREEAARAGVLRGAAQAQLEGRLVQLSGAPYMAGVAGTPPAYRLEGRVVLRLRVQGTVRREYQVFGSEDYLGGPDLTLTELNRGLALKRLMQRLGQEAWRQLDEG